MGLECGGVSSISTFLRRVSSLSWRSITESCRELMSFSIMDLDVRVEEEFVELGILLTVLSRASCARFVAV